MANFKTIAIVIILSLASVAVASSLEDQRLFYVNFQEMKANEFRHSKSVFFPGFSAANPQTSIDSFGHHDGNQERGEPLGPHAVRMLEDVRSGGLSSIWSVMPLGLENQAVRFDAKDRVASVEGAITFWFSGQAWDYTNTQDKNKDIPKRENFRLWNVDTSLRETFFEFRGEEGRVTFGKLAPRQFTLESPSGSISFPIDVDLSLVHQIAIIYREGKAQILIDGQVKAEGLFAMPNDIRKIMLGHIGPGTDRWNRWMDDVSFWKRPLMIAELMQLYRKEGMIQLPLQVTIPRIVTPPTIDGIVETDEWTHAATITGMHAIEIRGGYSAFTHGGELSDLEDTVSLAYDQNYLYVGYHCPPPREIANDYALIAAMLKKGVSIFDASVDFDDSLHIQIQYPRPGGDLYNLYVNGINTHYDFHFAGHLEDSLLPGQPSNVTLAWDPKWQTASTLDMDGWHVEAAIPLSDFNIPIPQDGDVWYVNFMRNWQTLRSGIQSWAWGNRTSNVDGNKRSGAAAGRMVFGNDHGVIAKLQSIGAISQGKPRFVVELVNPSQRTQTVICTVSSNSGELADEQRISVPGHGVSRYIFKGSSINPLTSSVVLKVTNGDGHAILTAGYPIARPVEVDIYMRKYPNFDQLKYEIDFTSLAMHDLSDIALAVRITRENNEVVWEKQYNSFDDYKTNVEISTKSFDIGAYDVIFEFVVKGKIAEAATQRYEKKPLPQWHGNTLGFDSDNAPYPWNDIVVKDGRVTLWGRTYQWNNSLYPHAVTTQKQAILRSPMGIHAVIGGQRISPVTPAKIRWTRLTKSRVEGIASIKLDNLTLENHFAIEYDGLVSSTLKLIPDGSVVVDSLAFEIPFTQDFSDVINAHDYSMRHTGKIKPEGYAGPPSALWIGNAIGGIQWDTETSGYFDVNDLASSAKVLYDDDVATMRIEFINIPTQLKKTRELPFYFMATPVRPKTLRTPEGERFRRYRVAIGRWQDLEPAWVPFQSHWLSSAHVKRGRLSGPTLPGVEARPVHHTTLSVLAGTDEAMQEFGDEWLVNPTQRWRGVESSKQRVKVTTAAQGYRDYVVWRFNEYFSKQPVPGGYFDVSSPVSSTNPYAQAGYIRDDGTRMPSLDLIGHRMIVKRIYNIQNTIFPGGALWWHASEGPRMMYMSYCIGNYDGENGNSIVNANNPTYRNMLTPATYRAQYMGSNWGHWNHFLSMGRISINTLKTYGFDTLWDQWTGLQLLHDNYRGTGWFGKAGHLEVLLIQRDAFPLNTYHMFSPFNRFIGYWDQDIVLIDNPTFYASFYIKDPVKPKKREFFRQLHASSWYSNYDTGMDGTHQAVLIFYNHGDYRGEVVLKPDWKKLGFTMTDPITATNAIHSTGFRVLDWDKSINELEAQLYDNSEIENVRINDGELRFPITPYNYRMIVLQTPRPWKGLIEIKH